MKHMTCGKWQRVQRRTARRVYFTGGKVAVSEPGAVDGWLFEAVGERTVETFETLPAAYSCWDGERGTCAPVWWWAMSADVRRVTARPSNHDPREKAELAQRINRFYIAQGTGPVIAGERLASIPRRLLRQLWREIREALDNEAIAEAATSIIM